MSMDRISRQVGGAPTEAILFMSSMIELFASSDGKRNHTLGHFQATYLISSLIGSVRGAH